MIYSWGRGSVRKETIDAALADHEHRMVGSRLYSERYIKERDFIEYETVAIPDKNLFSFNGEITEQTNHIERREIKKWKYFLMEKTYEEKWNKYKDEHTTKVIIDMPIKELTADEYQAYKKVAWKNELKKYLI